MLSTEGDVDPVGLRAAKQLISDETCRAAIYHEQTPSTSTLALADLHDGDLPAQQRPKLYLADRQTAGRGRHGRHWTSTTGSLTFSLVVDRARLSDQAGGSERASKLVSLAVGVGIARSLEFGFAPLNTRLKWPNDVHISGGKVAGILLETTPMATDQLVVGVGVNVAQSPDLGDDPAAKSVRSLSGVVGHHVQRYELLGPLVVNILSAIAQVDEFADDLVAEFRARCLLTGQRISFQDGQRRCEGACGGVSDDGELLVETDSGTRRLQSGEASLVRAQ